HLLAVWRDPREILDAADAASLKIFPPPKNRLRQPEVNQLLYKFKQSLLFVGEVPVDPAQLVVLTVRIVVALLRPAHLVAVANHRHALRKEESGEDISYLPRPQLIDRWIIRRPFNAAIPAQVVVLSVAVLF